MVKPRVLVLMGGGQLGGTYQIQAVRNADDGFNLILSLQSIKIK